MVNERLNSDLKSPKLLVSASDYRTIIKSSETAPNKGFSVIRSPNPLFNVTPFLQQRLRRS